MLIVQKSFGTCMSILSIMTVPVAETTSLDHFDFQTL